MNNFWTNENRDGWEVTMPSSSCGNSGQRSKWAPLFTFPTLDRAGELYPGALAYLQHNHWVFLATLHSLLSPNRGNKPGIRKASPQILGLPAGSHSSQHRLVLQLRLEVTSSQDHFLYNKKEHVQRKMGNLGTAGNSTRLALSPQTCLCPSLPP